MKRTNDENRFLSPSEVADLLNVSTRTIMRRIAEGELPAMKIGRQWRLSRTDIDAYLRRGRTGDHRVL